MNSKNKSARLKAIILITIFVSVLFYSCGSKTSNTSEYTAGTPVTLTHPDKINMKAFIELNGNTVFLNKEIIRSTFNGFIKKVFKNIGDYVNPGDTLFQINTQESTAIDTLKLKMENQLFQGSVFIKANSSGVLTELNYHTGDFVSTGEQIAIVSNPSSLRIKLNVPYEDALKVKIGNMCEITLPDNVTVMGVIEKSVPVVDPTTQTQTYFIKLNNYKSLPENLNLMVKIPYEVLRNTTALPKSSIVTNVTEDSFWVMKLINDTTAVRVNIKKGIENDSIAQIISPKLEIADKIILTGAYGLPDTAKIEIVK